MTKVERAGAARLRSELRGGARRRLVSTVEARRRQDASRLLTPWDSAQRPARSDSRYAYLGDAHD
jgi:hypothetical protein